MNNNNKKKYPFNLFIAADNLAGIIDTKNINWCCLWEILTDVEIYDWPSWSNSHEISKVPLL